VNRCTAKRSIRGLTVACVFLGLSSVAFGQEFESQRQQNWHQWRGPDATGLAPLADPPVEWDTTKNVKWKVAIPGLGNSTPIVWGDRIFLTTAVKTETVANVPDDQFADKSGGRFGIVHDKHVFQFVVLCLDRATGNIRWQQVAHEGMPHEGYHPDNSYATPSPTTDGRRVYVSFGSRGIYCYDLDGNLQWQSDLGDMETRLSFGEGSSPVLHGDSLVLAWDHDGQSFIAFLDALSGETRWQSNRDEPTNWSTPRVVSHGGRTQVIANGTNRVRSYDLNSGDLLWECGGQVSNAIPSPVANDGEGVVYCTSGYQGSALYALPLDASGDITDTDHVLWSRDEATPYCPSPLLMDGLLYFNQSNRAILSIVAAASGESVLGQTRMPGLQNIYASPLGAAGRVYFVGRDGTTLVIRAGQTMDVLATNALDDPIDASPAAAGNQLFLRSKTHLYCIEEQ